MKTTGKSFFRVLFYLLFISLVSAGTANGTDLQKTYTWKYNINKDGSVMLDNYDCNVTIHTWDKGETEYHLTIDAKTRTDGDAAVLDKFLQDLKFANSPGSVTFKDNFWESRNNIMGRMTMKLQGGKEVAMSEFSVKGELWMPSGCRFDLRSKYSEITMEDFAGQLTLDLYNDNFYGNNVNGKTTLTDKYSTIEFKDLKDVKAELYNSKVDAANTGKFEIESKYSRINALSSGSLNIESYNDKIGIPKTGDITFTAKYSDLKTETSGKLIIDCYEGSVSVREALDVKISSKYADFQFSRAGDISVNTSYNDKFSAEKITSLMIQESKYCSFSIGELTKSVSENDGYEDKFFILKTGPEFSGMSVDGKYVDISLSISKTTDYRLKAKINYPKLDLDESKMTTKTKISDGSMMEYEAVKGAEKEGMPLIEVKGYEMSLKIIGI
jgi:hypothetical protein